MNFTSLNEKRINYKTIIILVLIVSAFFGIWLSGKVLGDWLIDYLGISQIQSIQQVKK